MADWAAGFPYTFPITFSPFPPIIVAAGFSANALDETPTWDALEQYVQSVHVKRGRHHFLDRIEAGTCTLQLRNTDDRFFPLNSAGPYYPNVLPGVPITVRTSYGGTSYHLFYGFAEDWGHDWVDPSQQRVPAVRLTAVDLFKPLALFLLNNAGYAQARVDERLGRVLDSYGWPTVRRSFDTADTTVKATGTLTNENALNHLHVLAESEIGLIFVQPDGDVEIQHRYARQEAPYSTVQATFGEDPGEQHYHGVELEGSDRFVRNDIRITRDGGTEQSA